MASTVNITSEIAPLRKVIVHSPGPELLAVTPSNRREYLYDDIIDLEGAAEEHRRFASILRRFAKVYELRDLLEETLANDEAKAFLLHRAEEATADQTLRSTFGAWTAEQIVERFIEGWRQPSGPFSEKLEKQSYILPPLPNIFFTRDAAMVVGDNALISAMRYRSRWPEELLMRTILGFHPEIGGSPIIYDGSRERRHDFMIEGGDVHPISPEVVVIGLSERTSVAAVDALSALFFEHTPVRDFIAVLLPERSTAIHLDMVWTQVDRELCVAHPPFFRGPTRAPVLRRHKGDASVIEESSIFAALENVGLPMQPIWAGGDRWEMQEREQWASGCNFLTVRPGQTLAYGRNEETIRAMEKTGFRIIDGEALLLGDDTLDDGERAVITFAGSELVRGGGGPRCMSCPILRD